MTTLSKATMYGYKIQGKGWSSSRCGFQEAKEAAAAALDASIFPITGKQLNAYLHLIRHNVITFVNKDERTREPNITLEDCGHPVEFHN